VRETHHENNQSVIQLVRFTHPTNGVETMSDHPAVGIDLGTTYSVVSWLDDQQRPITLINAEGDRVTPSVVLFDGDEVVVGKEALKAMGTETEHVAECSKRDIGHRAFHKVIGGKQYPPEVVEAWILNKLRLDTIARVGPVNKAPISKVVITVPAYFDEVRRKATQDAGYMAGFEVNVRRDRDGDPRQRVRRPGHRRRRATGRLRLGPAAGRPGRRAIHPRALR
jgi:molecular chaperone DnaK